MAGAGAAAVLLAGGCGGQSTLDTHSRQSQEIASLFWWMLVAAGIVLVGALGLLAVGYRRRGRPGLPVIEQTKQINMWLVVTFGILLPLVALVAVFVVANFTVASITDAPAQGSTAMTIEVVGHQWFWEIRYPGTPAVTANELHIPARTRINVVLRSSDVIHSFWVPELNRKVDMIPGYPNRTLLYADQPGVYRGQCAELCGVQHANMAMRVVAQKPARFRRWLAGEAHPQAPPATATQRAGAQAFAANGCSSCHTIRGTPAHGTVGPDLTHLESRQTLAALTIPNTPAELRRWIQSPQQVKPGNKMPSVALSDAALTALVAYLDAGR